MALIKCPECGKEVSDKAQNCPNCGYPIASSMPSGMVQIRVNPLKKGMMNGKQGVAITSKNGETLWEGQTGDTAEIYFDGPADITVKYKLSMLQYGGSCSGRIDPAKSKKYTVSARAGVMSTKLVLQAVDVFDAD